MKTCKICDKTKDLKFCSKCHSVAYCSVEHQKQDWKDHKENCKESFSSYTKPKLNLKEAISESQLMELISGPIQLSNFEKERDVILADSLLYSKEKNNFLLTSDVEVIPFFIENENTTFKEKKYQEVNIYISDNNYELKSRKIISFEFIVDWKYVEKFEFLSYTLETPVHLLQASFDYIFHHMNIPSKTLVNIYSNFNEILMVKMLYGQTWRSWDLKQFGTFKLGKRPTYVKEYKKFVMIKKSD